MKNWNCKTPIKINRENLLDIDLGNDDFEYDTNSTGNKSKNKQVELHRTIAKKLYQSLYIVKETINTVKRQPMEWEKISANHVFDKVLISKSI